MAFQSDRPIGQALLNGLHCRCPACGKGALYNAYLKVNERCPSCGQELWHHRADDAPPYMVITIVGHIIVPALLAVEMALHPALWIHPHRLAAAHGHPLAGDAAAGEGALIGFQWAVRMHGFDPTDEEYDPVPPSRRPDATLVPSSSRPPA